MKHSLLKFVMVAEGSAPVAARPLDEYDGRARPMKQSRGYKGAAGSLHHFARMERVLSPAVRVIDGSVRPFTVCEDLVCRHLKEGKVKSGCDSGRTSGRQTTKIQCETDDVWTQISRTIYLEIEEHKISETKGHAHATRRHKPQ